MMTVVDDNDRVYISVSASAPNCRSSQWNSKTFLTSKWVLDKSFYENSREKGILVKSILELNTSPRHGQKSRTVLQYNQYCTKIQYNTIQYYNTILQYYNTNIQYY